MQVRDIMTPRVETISPREVVADAAAKMKNLDVGSLPVCDGNRLLGMITDRDITVRATSSGVHPHDRRVEEVMTPDVIFCFDDQDVSEAAQIMEVKQVRRLPVLNRNMELVGIVALGDVATRAPDDSFKGEALQGISEPSEPQNP